MNSAEFVAKYGKIYQKYLAKEKNEDYEINFSQLEKFADIMNFFKDILPLNGGKIEEVHLVPKEVRGDLIAKFLVLDLYFDQIQRFCDVMRGASTLSIDSTTDGNVCISISVNNVYRKKVK